MNVLRATLSLTLILAAINTSHAALVIPNADGSDGPLNITGNTVIDLSQAVTGNWDANNSANAGNGIYDPAKWAVVFKYSQVNIAAGATVTFKNHPSRAPVVWLVNGNATIDGTVSLDGQNAPPAPLLAEPGPGGFRGGVGVHLGVGTGPGFGPGGGQRTAVVDIPSRYAAGGYGTPGTALFTTPSQAYGNPSVVPLIGGSGGGSTLYWDDPSIHLSGGAGGGAILIAVAAELTVNGTVRAIGGAPTVRYSNRHGGAGSGGGIRLLANSLAGTGSILAPGGSTSDPSKSGGVGRIRIERALNNNTLSVVPDPSVVDLADGATALLWPPVGAPEARIVSVGGVNAPADPRAGFGTLGADVSLPLTASTQVFVETTNVEQAAQVKVRATPRANANFTEVTASVDTLVSADPLVIRWVASLPLNAGYSALQVRVIRP